MKSLQVLVGDWIAEGTLTFKGKAFKIGGTAKLMSAAAGWGVANFSKLDIEGVGSYEEVDVLGFDPIEKLFHFFSVTNTGAARDHEGKWLDDKTIRFGYEGLQEGKTYVEEISVNILSSRELTIHERDTLDGQVITIMHVSLRK